MQTKFFHSAKCNASSRRFHPKIDDNIRCLIIDLVPKYIDGFEDIMTLLSIFLQGVLPNGNMVAVKKLFAKTSQGIDEFLNEVVLLTGMKHRNLVNLKGCCIHNQERLLVYEYVDNYDIDKVLLGESDPHFCRTFMNILLYSCLRI